MEQTHQRASVLLNFKTATFKDEKELAQLDIIYEKVAAEIFNLVKARSRNDYQDLTFVQ